MLRTPRTRSLRAPLGAALLTILAGFATTACGADTTPAAPPPPAANTPTRAADADQGRIFTADPTIVGARPIPVTAWTPLGEDRIALGFQTGSPECYGVDVTVTETDEQVLVELRSGSRAQAVGRMCTMIAVFGTLEVPLRAPLGDRTVTSAA